ncbi:acyl-CoA dehydrogenase, partial [Streptomyces apricus]
MDLSYTPEDEEFRARLREWLAETLPALPPGPSPDDWPARRAA